MRIEVVEDGQATLMHESVKVESKRTRNKGTAVGMEKGELGRTSVTGAVDCHM